MILNFGKYAGVHIYDVPEDYIEWMIDKCKKDIIMWENELERRLNDPHDNWEMRIIKAGYKTLIKQHHPDVGGNTKDAQQLNSAFQHLKSNVEQS